MCDPDYQDHSRHEPGRAGDGDHGGHRPAPATGGHGSHGSHGPAPASPGHGEHMGHSASPGHTAISFTGVDSAATVATQVRSAINASTVGVTATGTFDVAGRYTWDDATDLFETALKTAVRRARRGELVGV